MARQTEHSHNITGFSLIEVLIALFVLSIGMLGISALSISSFKSNRDALYRSRAVVLADDLAERIRANPTVDTTYKALLATTVSTDKDCTQEPAATVPGRCTAVNLAEDDVFFWQQALKSGAGGLPEGSGKLDIISSGPPAKYRITVQWEQLSDASGSTGTQYASVVLEFQN